MAGGNDLLDAQLVECLQIGFCEHLEQIFVTGSTSCITTAPSCIPRIPTSRPASFMMEIVSEQPSCFVHRTSCTSCKVNVFGRFGDLDIEISSPITCSCDGNPYGFESDSRFSIVAINGIMGLQRIHRIPFAPSSGGGEHRLASERAQC